MIGQLHLRFGVVLIGGLSEPLQGFVIIIVKRMILHHQKAHKVLSFAETA